MAKNVWGPTGTKRSPTYLIGKDKPMSGKGKAIAGGPMSKEVNKGPAKGGK